MLPIDKSRSYVLDVHIPAKSAAVKPNDKTLPGLEKREEFQAAAEGWFFDPRDRRRVLHVKTKAISLAAGFAVKVSL